MFETEFLFLTVRHARKFFTGFEEEQLCDVQHCMALLAFPASTQLSPYKELLEESRWDKLIEQFRHENYRLFQLSSQSVFTVALQAGLSALKTPYPFHTATAFSCIYMISINIILYFIIII